jgi:hypothetical protein
MRKTITNLSGLIMALACMTTALRAQRPDSIITYTATGEKYSKEVCQYDTDARIVLEENFDWQNNTWINTFKGIYVYNTPGKIDLTWYLWENNSWKLLSSEVEDRQKQEAKVFASLSDRSYMVFYPTSGRGPGKGEGWTHTVKYNTNNDPVLYEFHDNNQDGTVTVTYDAGDNPLQIEWFHEMKNPKRTYNSMVKFQYDGNRTVVEDFDWDDGQKQMVLKSTSSIVYNGDTTWYYTDMVYYTVAYYASNVANETVSASAPTAYAHGGTLYLQSPRAEKVAIYAISGAKLYEGAIPAGTTTIAARLPKGVCIVAFGDGTRRKVWISE